MEGNPDLKRRLRGLATNPISPSAGFLGFRLPCPAALCTYLFLEQLIDLWEAREDSGVQRREKLSP